MSEIRKLKLPKEKPRKTQNKRGNRICNALAAGVIILFCLQLFSAAPRLSATTDEPVHLSAGYSYWQTRDFRINPEHPPLAKLLAALPLLVLRPGLDTSSKEWAAADEYPFGFAFLYGNDADRLLLWGRVPMIVLAALGAFITFLFARDLFGPFAGVFAVGLYSFCPNLLAHGMLVTTDVPLSTFMLLTLYLFWRQPLRPAWHSSLLVGLSLGAAMTSKYSGALLPILITGLATVRVLGQKDRKKEAISHEIRNLTLIATASLFVIGAVYLFSASPALYFKNSALVNANHQAGYESYLLGELKQNGWWYYFLVAFVLKATLPALILLSIAAVKTFSGFIDFWGETILLSAIAFYFVAVSIGADDLGVRYLLPVFPLIYVWGSRIVPSFWNDRLGRTVLLCLIIWQVWAAVSSFPDYIPYFNELAGGAQRGPDYLDDSNVDWGQSLEEVSNYVRAKHLENVVLCPFSGFENPAYYGLNSTVRAPKQLVSNTPTPGIYIISAHNIAWMRTVDAAWRAHQPIDRVGGMWVYRF